MLAGPLHLPDDPELLIRANGAAMVGAGAMLATGRFPRLAALVLAGTLVPTTVAGHRFWEEADPVQKRNQRLHLLKNVSLLGGTLLAVVDTGGQARRALADAPGGQGCGPHGPDGQAGGQARDARGQGRDPAGRPVGQAVGPRRGAVHRLTPPPPAGISTEPSHLPSLTAIPGRYLARPTRGGRPLRGKGAGA